MLKDINDQPSEKKHNSKLFLRHLAHTEQRVEWKIRYFLSTDRTREEQERQGKSRRRFRYTCAAEVINYRIFHSHSRREPSNQDNSSA